jgi:phosphatidate cytidylyltransferase
MLRLRIATAVVGLPIVVWILGWGPHWAHLLFFLACLAVAVAEASRILQPRLDDLFAALEPADDFDAALKARRLSLSLEDRRRQYFVLSSFCVLVAAFMFLAAALLPESKLSGVLIAGLLVAILVGVFATRGIDAEMARVIGFVVSIVYAGLPWIAIWDLNMMGEGARFVFLLLMIVWAGDTGGYFGGRFFGRHKLAPHKSPKKTWEGAITGILASIAGAHILSLFYAAFSTPLASSLTLTLAGFFGGMAGQLGDLVESVFKRFAKVKDSGAIFPGHGGFLDRADGLLFAAPVLWCILIFSN